MVSAAICVVFNNLLKAAITLALTSAILSIIMFVLQATLVAVFELSVCSGLITVVFISAISMTKVATKEELEEKQRLRNKRFILLPVVLIASLTVLLLILWPHISSITQIGAVVSGVTAQDILWNKHQVDLLGQIVILIAGVFGIIIFFKEVDSE